MNENENLNKFKYTFDNAKFYIDSYTSKIKAFVEKAGETKANFNLLNLTEPDKALIETYKKNLWEIFENLKKEKESNDRNDALFNTVHLLLQCYLLTNDTSETSEKWKELCFYVDKEMTEMMLEGIKNI